MSSKRRFALKEIYWGKHRRRCDNVNEISAMNFILLCIYGIPWASATSHARVANSKTIKIRKTFDRGPRNINQNQVKKDSCPANIHAKMSGLEIVNCSTTIKNGIFKLIDKVLDKIAE